MSISVTNNEQTLRLAKALSQDLPDSTQYRIDVGIGERRLADGLLAAAEGASTLHHAEQAMLILCREDVPTGNASTLSNCGRAQLAADNTNLALHNPNAAQTILRKAAKITSTLCENNPPNAIFRSIWPAPRRLWERRLLWSATSNPRKQRITQHWVAGRSCARPTRLLPRILIGQTTRPWPWRTL